jgi:hypothetical protein
LAIGVPSFHSRCQAGTILLSFSDSSSSCNSCYNHAGAADIHVLLERAVSSCGHADVQMLWIFQGCGVGCAHLYVTCDAYSADGMA